MTHYLCVINNSKFSCYVGNQILVTDLGNCQAVKIFLTMCNLPYKIVVKENCEFMSPSGKL